VWEVATADLGGSEPDATGTGLLVPVGAVDGRWTAVDLGRAPGPVAVTGPAAGMAVHALLDDLLDRPRPSRPAVTLVGPAPTRPVGDGLRVVGTVAEVGAAGAPAAPDVTGMLDVWGGPSPTGLRDHLVVATADVGPPDLDRLAALAADADRTAAVVVVGEHPAAAWRFPVTAEGRLDPAALGLRPAGAPTP
jgi:hypothetical protein